MLILNYDDFRRQVQSTPTGEPIYIDGFVDLKNSPHFDLPENLTITHELNLHQSKIRSLPKGLQASRIDVSNSQLIKLPSDLKCQYLEMSRTAISEIPDTIQVSKALYATHTKLTTIPKMLGDVPLLFLNYLKDFILPDDFHMKGTLVCDGSSFVRFPKNLKVDNSLHLNSMDHVVIPSCLQVKNELLIRGAESLVLPPNARFGSLDLQYTLLSSLPENLHLDDELDIRDTQISILPGSLHVGKLLVIDDGIELIPETLHPEMITLHGTTILVSKDSDDIQFPSFSPIIVKELTASCLLEKSLQTDNIKEIVLCLKYAEQAQLTKMHASAIQQLVIKHCDEPKIRSKCSAMLNTLLGNTTQIPKRL